MKENSFGYRRDIWLRDTGLIKSSASHQKVLRWLNQYTLPGGFDHTEIYYFQHMKFHILITEPYHSTDEALESISKLAESKGKKFSYALGDKDHGLWYPGYCFSLLIGDVQYRDYINFFAERLNKNPALSIIEN